jgi:predicted Fe-Mo cluster-binding NifX family protein
MGPTARGHTGHPVEAVVANQIGDGMARLLGTMGLMVLLGAAGDSRAAIQTVTREP